MKRSLVNGISSVLGGVHFAASYTAEKAFIAEMKLKQIHLGQSAEDIAANRRAITLARIDRLDSLFKSKEQIQAELVIVELNSNV
jgi:hypothetical protein